MRARTMGRTRRKRLVIGVAVLLVALVVAVWGGLGRGDDGQHANPFTVRTPFVDPDSAATRAATSNDGSLDDTDRDLLRRLGAVPTAIWLVPEALGVGQVGGRVRSLVKASSSADRELVLVIYGIADRDCGGYSSGGLRGDAYQAWVREIAAAAGEGHVSVVLEPDALALAGDCGDPSQRLQTLHDAVDELVSRGVVTYVDAGHSNWVPPATMAERLRAVGIDRARGFATNVANFNLDADERGYAEQLSRLLDGAHYVIDSGRNGAGSNGTVCNPPGRAVGTRPGFVDDGSGQDAYLWIKPPGESDGECQGGPPAGSWWTAAAVELARNAGW